MKRVLLLLAMAMVPVALFASEGAETNYDIVQRTVNFIIFAAILWYLLADKIKAFFANRTLGIQSELDKVQDSLKASKDRVAEAQKKLDDAKKISAEIIESAKSDIENIKQKVSASVDADIANLSKNLDEMIKVEISKNRVTEAKKKLDNAKKISAEIIESAKSDIENIKQKVSTSIDTDIANLSKNLDEMIKVEISKAKKQVVAEILDELLNSENIKLSQDELVNIVLKRVA